MGHQSWYGAAGEYLGTWMTMMVPMMLPSFLPMASRFRRSVPGGGGWQRHGLTALVAAGYLTVWLVVGVAAFAGDAVVGLVDRRWGSLDPWLPLASGVVLLAAGGVQFTAWKARHLMRCRAASPCHGPPPSSLWRTWRHGLRLGVECSLCCGNLMMALLAMGMMHVVVMAALTLAISAERLAAAPLRVARAAGLALALIGAATIAGV